MLIGDPENAAEVVCRHHVFAHDDRGQLVVVIVVPMTIVAAIDWTAMGAIAGPLLALVALGWQASERLRRLIVDAHFNSDRYRVITDRDQIGVAVTATCTVLNPRPAAVVLVSWRMEARDGWLPWRRTVLDVQRGPVLVEPHGEVRLRTHHDDLRAPSTLRVSVSTKGRRRTLRSAWSSVTSEVFNDGSKLRVSVSGTYRTPSDPPYPAHIPRQRCVPADEGT